MMWVVWNGTTQYYLEHLTQQAAHTTQFKEGRMYPTVLSSVVEGNGCMHIPPFYLPSVADRTPFISFETALEKPFLWRWHNNALGHIRHWLWAHGCSCASDEFCITLTTLLQLHYHTLHVHWHSRECNIRDLTSGLLWVLSCCRV